MRIIKETHGDFTVILPGEGLEPPLLIPRCSAEAGYFTFSDSDLKVKTFTAVVLGVSKKILDIPPYYENAEFTLVNLLPTSPEFLEEYGGSCTELYQMRLLGKSKDVFTRKLGSYVRSEMVRATNNGRTFYPENCFPFYATFAVVPEVSLAKKRYFSVSTKCEMLDADPLNLQNEVNFNKLMYLSEVKEKPAALVPEQSLSIEYDGDL